MLFRSFILVIFHILADLLFTIYIFQTKMKKKKTKTFSLPVENLGHPQEEGGLPWPGARRSYPRSSYGGDAAVGASVPYST